LGIDILRVAPNDNAQLSFTWILLGKGMPPGECPGGHQAECGSEHSLIEAPAAEAVVIKCFFSVTAE